MIIYGLTKAKGRGQPKLLVDEFEVTSYPAGGIVYTTRLVKAHYAIAEARTAEGEVYGTQCETSNDAVIIRLYWQSGVSGQGLIEVSAGALPSTTKVKVIVIGE